MVRLLVVAATTVLLCSIGAPPVLTQSEGAETARQQWQRVPDVLHAMAAREGAVVADVGAGSLPVRHAQSR